MVKFVGFNRPAAQSRSQSFVPLDQRSENESSGSIRFEITMGNNRILVIWFTAQSQSASISCYGACLKWLLPELSFSDRWSRGTKLWERDCPAALFVVFCCEGLLAFFPVLLQLLTNCILSTAISVFSVVISYLQQSSN